MSHHDRTFFTSVGCMDGRVQDVVADFGRKRFGAKYPDTITEAGLVGKVATEGIWEDLRFKVVDVSLGRHSSKGVIVHGHQDCAGNPVDDEVQKQEILRSVELIKQIAGTAPVIGIFVTRSESEPLKWEIEVIGGPTD